MENSFTIFNASAGSGKTYTLVKKYLVLLLTSRSNDGYKNILAITFTNKAVAEMKTRIISSLKSLSKEEKNKKEQDLLAQLAEESRMQPQEIEQRSRAILRNIIHDYAAFEVSTIDRFTHRVLRTFAKDLGLPMNFEVELRTEDILIEAVDRVISKAGEDKALTKVLVNFVLQKTDDDKSWDIARDLVEIAKLLTRETDQPFLEMLKHKKLEDFVDLSKKVKKQIDLVEEALKAVCEGFFDLLESNGIVHDDFTRGSCPGFFEKVQNADYSMKLDLVWQEDLEAKALYSKKVAEDKKEILDRLQPEIFQSFTRAKNGILVIQFLEAIHKNLVPLSLLSSIQNEIEEIKKENSMVLISEFNSTIGKAVKDQPAPFIYERLGEHYRHYFVDEFQDTSQLQWENLIPLVDHTLTTEHQKPDFGSLTLVGDAKQSIYRWRGGKAEQFMELCKEKNPFNLQNKELVVLPKNYRSAKTIVDFNNHFFNFSSCCFQRKEHQELFENSSQEITSGKEGYVNISFIEAENVDEEMEVYPQRVLEIIQKLEKQEVQKSGICILTRKRKESMAVANYLSEHGIPVISAESLLLSRSAEVGVLNHVLQFCLEPNNKTLKFEILDYVLRNLDGIENEFQFLKHALELNGQEFFAALRIFGIDINLDYINAVSVYEAVEYLIRNFRMVKDSDAYLQFYLDFVFETSHSEGFGILTFLEVWERKKNDLSIVVPQGENAVQIMTIHKAKGLEFPIVIFPFANSPVKDTGRENLWINLPDYLKSEISVAYLRASEKMKNWDGDVPALYEELCCNSQLDALNVLYVALTRPVQQLYVVSKYEVDKKGNENENKISGLLISYLKHIQKWDESREHEFGNFHELPEVEHDTTDSVQQETFFSSPTQGKGISIITRSGTLWNSYQQHAIEKGQLVHDLFARINDVGDVSTVLDEAREEGIFKEQDEEAVKNVIFEVVNHPELKDFYSEDCVNFNERDMISGKGEILRPDRINFEGKKAFLIDYKTGAESKKHHDQLNAYAQVLSAMKFSVEKKLLVYINERVSISVV